MSIMYPLQLYSWNVLSQNITYKVVDKTLVQSIETGFLSFKALKFSESILYFNMV